MIVNTDNKTRFAPTPSGFLHIGNVLSFGITASLAKKHTAKIALRIDDLDHERFREEYLEDIFDTLHFLHIPWHEGPKDASEQHLLFSQAHRLKKYYTAVERLIQGDHVFACNCSRTTIHSCQCQNKHIALDTPDTCLRIKDYANSVTVPTFNGLETHSLPKLMKNFIVRKRDGFPAYQLTSVIDDLNYQINMIVRGNDLWPSTLAQLYLAQLLDEKKFGETLFVHHPLLTDEFGNKLSKSAGAQSIRYLRSQNHSAENIWNMIGHLTGTHFPIHSWECLDKYILP